MTRPIYETPQDLTNQEKLLRQALFALNPRQSIKYTRSADLAPYDYVTEDPHIIFEIKSRNLRQDRFDTYKISAQKIDRINALGEESGLPAVLVVGWTDKWGWMPLYSPRQEVTTLKTLLRDGEAQSCTWGRTDRGDSYDVEKSYEWPIRRFRIFEYADLEKK
mgnify:FL=1